MERSEDKYRNMWNIMAEKEYWSRNERREKSGVKRNEIIGVIIFEWSEKIIMKQSKKCRTRRVKRKEKISAEKA